MRPIVIILTTIVVLFGIYLMYVSSSRMPMGSDGGVHAPHGIQGPRVIGSDPHDAPKDVADAMQLVNGKR